MHDAIDIPVVSPVELDPEAHEIPHEDAYVLDAITEVLE